MGILQVLDKQIVYFGRQTHTGCDAKCHKAWGMQLRPAVYLDAEGKVIKVYLGGKGKYDLPDGADPDNHAYIPDELLGNAPEEPGTWEGFEGKEPESLNKWCVRQCERNEIGEYDDPMGPLKLKNFSDFLFNIPSIEKVVKANPGWRKAFEAAVEAQRNSTPPVD